MLPRLTIWLRTGPLAVVGPSLLVALVLLATGLWGFGVLVEDYLTDDPIVGFDQRLADWLHQNGSATLTQALVAVTTLGSATILVPLALLAVGWLLRRRRRADAVLVALAVIGAEILTLGLKAGFHRQRPFFSDPLAVEDSFSFPSGHATVSLATYGALAFVVARHSPSRRRAAAWAGGAAALVLLIGFSRLYLGVHFLSDVLAGFSAGLVWLVLCVLAVFARRGGAGRASA